MALWTDLIEPRELTVFARRAAEDAEGSEGSLSRFFPSVSIDGDTAKYTQTETGLVDTAEFRAWDTESSVGQYSGGGKRVAIELPPVSRKIRIGELDHIRDRNDTNNQLRIAARATADSVKAVENRMEVARADILNTGRVVIEENGFHVDVDLGRSPDMEVTSANSWANADADIIEDMISWVEHYEDTNHGLVPETILGSRRIISLLQRNDVIKGAVRGEGTTSRTVLTLDEINQVFGSYGLPTITTFDRKANVGGQVRRLLPENNLYLLPAAGSNVLGQTVFGRTAEADDPQYGFASNEAPGLVAALHRVYDPFGTWAHVNAIGLPVMSNPNASMVATVVPDEG